MCKLPDVIMRMRARSRWGMACILTLVASTVLAQGIGVNPRPCPPTFWKVDFECAFLYFSKGGGCFPANDFTWASAANPLNTQAYYDSKHFPTETDVVNRKVWNYSAVKAACWRKISQGPAGLIQIDYSTLETSLGTVSSPPNPPSGGTYCEPVEYQDPEEEPCDPWEGAEGGESDPPPGDPPGDGYGWLCAELDLEDGYWPVYVDGVYVETIHCGG